MIITIDGPVATGKTTIAKGLAERIGFIYFETGAMYRCATLAVQRAQLSPDDEEAIAALIKDFEFDMRIYPDRVSYFLENEEITELLRSQQVTAAVSQVSAYHAVRQRMMELQRQMAEGVNAVFEGRDMGSFVFPEAYLKVFLTASNYVRAKRRYEEICYRFPKEAATLTLEQVEQQIAERDRYDSQRTINPLVQPKDALVIDTSGLTIEEVVQAIIDYKDNMTVE